MRHVADAAAGINSDIERLLQEQRRVKDERKRVVQELKNAQRRRKRLKHRARLLSSDDLVRVLSLREAELAAKAARDAAPTSASTGSGGTASSNR